MMLMITDLVIGDKRDTVVDCHSADGKVILQVAGVVVGQVDHQVNVTITDESVNQTNTGKDYPIKEIKI